MRPHDLLKAQVLQWNNWEKLLMKQGEEEWDSRIRSYIIDGTCRIRKSYSWQGNLNKSAVWWSQEGWPVHPYHSEDGPFKGTGKFSNLNLLLWTFMKYNMLISWLHAVTLFFFPFNFCHCPSFLFIPKTHRIQNSFPLSKVALVFSSDWNVLPPDLFTFASFSSLRLQAKC